MKTIKAAIDTKTSELLAEYIQRSKREIAVGEHPINDTDPELIIGYLIRQALTTNQQSILRRLERIELKLKKS